MATLKEAGLSSNLGLTERSTTVDELVIATFHYGRDNIHTLRDRQASAFHLPDGVELEVNKDDNWSLGMPHRGTEIFREPTRRYLRPVFEERYAATHEHRYPASASVVIDDPEQATVADRAELGAYIESCKTRQIRDPYYLFVGQAAITAFAVSSLATLDIQRPGEMTIESDLFPVTGDDFIAMRLIQLADMCGIDIKRHIPVAHVEKVMHAVVMTTLVDFYRFLNTAEVIGNVDGRWRMACEKFAHAYGIEAGEVADLAMILNEEIYQAVQEKETDQLARRGNSSVKKTFALEKMTPAVAEKMAEYLLGERAA